MDQLINLPKFLDKSLHTLGSSVYKKVSVKAVQQVFLNLLQENFPESFSPAAAPLENKIALEVAKKKVKVVEVEENQTVSQCTQSQESLSKEEKVRKFYLNLINFSFKYSFTYSNLSIPSSHK